MSPAPRPIPAVALRVVVCLLLGPMVGCGGQAPRESGAARVARKKVILEIASMAGTPPLQVDQTIRGRHVSLTQIFADAGIDVQVQQVPTQLPRPSSGTVNLADLDALMAKYRTLPTDPSVVVIYGIIATAEEGHASDAGIMFDFGPNDADHRPREGFAIFWDALAKTGSEAPAEMLLTAAHELSHCFNVHHADWEGEGGTFFQRSTIESYSGADSSLWTLSARSKLHLASDTSREVWPGNGAFPFGYVLADHSRRHQPNTPADDPPIIVDASGVPVAPTGAAPSARAVARDRSRFAEADAGPVRLRIESSKPIYVIGEPIVLTIGLHNVGSETVHTLNLLDPQYRFLHVEVREPGAAEFRPFRPAVNAEARRVATEPLAPQQAFHAEAKIFYGAEGWTFLKAGAYTIRADYPAPQGTAGALDPAGRIQSAEFTLTLEAPTRAADSRARELILGRQQGQFLLLGGGDHLSDAVAKLRQVVSEAPTAAHASSVKLALGVAALDPTIDTMNGVKPSPRLDEAQRYLTGTVGTRLSPLAVVGAHAMLAQKLKEDGQEAKATSVQRMVVQKMGRQDAIQGSVALAQIERAIRRQ